MYTQIVVGTDGSPGARLAEDAAVELARLTGATLHVVHAHKVTSAHQLAAAVEVGVAPDVLGSNEEILAESRQICAAAVARAEGAGARAVAHSMSGDAADALVQVAADADVIVVGNRGMTGARRFVLGSVPNKVSHHCPSSLLIIDTSGSGG